MTLHNLLFCAHTLGLNYLTVTFLLVSSSGTNHDLLGSLSNDDDDVQENVDEKLNLHFSYKFREWLDVFSLPHCIKIILS